VERIGELWIETQSGVLGDAVELTEDYSMWWSYIPHFIGTPGYVYAYAYGQLLALSVYRRYTEQGPEFVPDYLEMLGIDKLADYDRMASVAETDAEIGWDEATELVLGAYDASSPELAETGRRFFDENWIDAPTRPGKRQGAFCAYTVPSHHPYLLLNWTGRRRDVLTLAHELGHGLHAQLARPQGVFHQTTPLTLAETASVFGETVTFGRLLDATTEPAARLGLLASQLEDSIATVFRQTAMNRFEHEIHTGRRE